VFLLLILINIISQLVNDFCRHSNYCINQMLVYIEIAFVLCQIPLPVGLIENSPHFVGQVRCVLQTLEYGSILSLPISASLSRLLLLIGSANQVDYVSLKNARDERARIAPSLSEFTIGEQSWIDLPADNLFR